MYYYSKIVNNIHFEMHIIKNTPVDKREETEHNKE